MRRIAVVVAVVLVVAILGIGAYVLFGAGGSEASGPAKVITDPKVIQKSTLGFVRMPYTDDYNILRLGGYVDNLSKDTIKTADLEMQLYDKDGNRKELVKYQVHDISPKGRKTFDANGGAISDSRTAKIKVTRLEVVQP